MEFYDIVILAAKELMSGIFCMGMAEITLGEEEKRGARLAKWCVGICAYVIVAMFWQEYGKNIFLDFFDSGQIERFVGEAYGDVILTIGYTLVNIIDMAKIVVLAIPMFYYLYRQEKMIKMFLAILTVLVWQAIENYLETILMLPFLVPDYETEMKMESSMIRLAVRCLLVFLSLGVYWQFFNKKMRRFLDNAKGNMKSFVTISILSGIFIDILVCLIRTYGIDYNAFYWQTAFIYFVIVTCLLFAYFMMYWCIFVGLSLSAEITKEQAELDVARNIQTSVLPCIFPAYPEREEFQLYATMDAAKEIGGDFYDFFLVDENHLAVVIADVSGKGIPAALFMMTAKTLLKNLVKMGKELGQTMMEANQRLCENNEAEMFVTVFLGILELDTGRFVYANAGHNPPFLYRNGSSYEMIKLRPGFVLGGMEGIRYRQQEMMLQAGDALFLYTDGVTEALNLEEELYSEKRLGKLLNSDKLREKTVEEILHAVREDIDAFADGAQQADDITMLMVKFTPAERRENVSS